MKQKTMSVATNANELITTFDGIQKSESAHYNMVLQLRKLVSVSIIDFSVQ